MRKLLAGLVCPLLLLCSASLAHAQTLTMGLTGSALLSSSAGKASNPITAAAISGNPSWEWGAGSSLFVELMLNKNLSLFTTPGFNLNRYAFSPTTGGLWQYALLLAELPAGARYYVSAGPGQLWVSASMHWIISFKRERSSFSSSTGTITDYEQRYGSGGPAFSVATGYRIEAFGWLVDAGLACRFAQSLTGFERQSLQSFSLTLGFSRNFFQSSTRPVSQTLAVQP